MSRLVFTTLGSSGDLFPLLPVAGELARRGHDVRFAANPSFREAVTREGFEFHDVGVPLGSDEYAAHPEILDPGRGGLAGIEALMKRFLLPHLPRVVEDLRAATEGADLLLTHPAQLASPLVAELTGVRWMTLSVFPGNIPSRHMPPQGSPLPSVSGGLGRAMNGLAWKLARRVIRSSFDGDLNGVRAAFGLPPREDIFLLGGLGGERVLVLCDQEYCGRPPDWDERVSCTGYTSFDTPRGWRDPAGLESFLESGTPPVLVSLGTSVAVDPQSFIGAAEAALERAGQRGLFLVGRGANIPRQPRSRNAYFEYVPLSRVLPRCRLAVHPGGFGTTAAVVAAGIPSIVVPRAFDQAYHARRIEELGLGRSIPWRRFSLVRLEQALGDALADRGLATRAREFATKLEHDGAGRAADAIEQQLAARTAA